MVIWKLRRAVSVFAAVALLFVVTGMASADPGARPMGMGGAFVAVADDAYSLYYNPAGLATGSRAHLTYSGKVNRRRHSMPRFNDYFGFSFSHEVREDTVGFGIALLRDRSYLGVEGLSDGREKQRQFHVGAAYRMSLEETFFGRSVSLGANWKSLRKEWSRVRDTDGTRLPATDDGWTYDYDVGLLWDIGAGFNLGLLGQYASKPSLIMAGESSYARTDIGRGVRVREWFNLRGGAAWKSPDGLLMRNDSLTLAVDFYDLINESRGEVDRDIRVGAEYVTGLGASGAGNGFIIRGGGYHIDNSDLETATGGVGFRSDAGWSLDYTALYGEATDNNLLSMVSVGFWF